MLSLHQISCHRGARLLLHNFSLHVGAGEIVWLTGPNGVGKSTLLRVMAGIQKPLGGKVQQQQALHFLSSDPGFDDDLTLADNLAWWAGIHGAPKSQIPGTLAKLDLFSQTALPFHALSKGQQQRAAFARLLIAPARLWLLDEPFAHLDKAGRSLALQLMGDHLRYGGGIIAATHDLADLPNQRIVTLSEAMA